MLVVLAIMAILTALAVPATTGLMQSYQVNVAGQLVTSQLALARQTALTTNHAVQVRFYYLPDYGQSFVAPPAVYRGIQCFEVGDIAPNSNTTTPNLIPLSKPNYFPQPIIGVSNNASSSSIVSMANQQQFSPLLNQAPATPSSSAGDPSLAGYAYNYKYLAVTFSPGGATNLSDGSISPGPAANNVVSFTVETAKPLTTGSAAGLPANYVTISIDPVTGTLRVYRP